MSKRANPKLVGAFVLGAVALIVAAVILLAGGSFWRASTQIKAVS